MFHESLSIEPEKTISRSICVRMTTNVCQLPVLRTSKTGNQWSLEWNHTKPKSRICFCIVQILYRSEICFTYFFGCAFVRFPLLIASFRFFFLLINVKVLQNVTQKLTFGLRYEFENWINIFSSIVVREPIVLNCINHYRKANFRFSILYTIYICMRVCI